MGIEDRSLGSLSGTPAALFKAARLTVIAGERREFASQQTCAVKSFAALFRAAAQLFGATLALAVAKAYAELIADTLDIERR